MGPQSRDLPRPWPAYLKGQENARILHLQVQTPHGQILTRAFVIQDAAVSVDAADLAVIGDAVGVMLQESLAMARSKAALEAVVEGARRC